jgi:hypothetical protein
MICCTAFDVWIHNEPFAVVFLEMPQIGIQQSPIGKVVAEQLKKKHKINVFTVMIFAPNTLPRLFPVGDLPGLVTSDTFGSRTVLLGPTNYGPEEFPFRKYVPIDPVLCRELFNSKNIPVLNMYLALDGETLKYVPFIDEAARISDRDTSRLQYEVSDITMKLLDDLLDTDLSTFTNIVDLLIWRCENLAKNFDCLSQCDNRGKVMKNITYYKLGCKVFTLSQFLKDHSNIKKDEKVLLLYNYGIDFIYALYACLYIGAVPILIRPPEVAYAQEDFRVISDVVSHYSVKKILVDREMEVIASSKTFTNAMFPSDVPKLINTTKIPKGKFMISRKDATYNPVAPSQVALIQIFQSPDVIQYYAEYSHESLLSQCNAQVIQNRMLNCTMEHKPNRKHTLGQNLKEHASSFMNVTSRCIINTIEWYNGLGFLHSCLLGIFVGSQTIIYDPKEYIANPKAWFDLVQKFNGKDYFLFYFQSRM